MDSKLFWKKKYLPLAIFVVLSSEYMLFPKVSGSEEETKKLERATIMHQNIVDAYFKKRMKMMTSNLGTILYKNADPKIFLNNHRQSRTYIVMVWMFWTKFVSVYLRTTNYDSEFVTQEILQNCSVKNCRYHSSYSIDIESADAVIFSTEQRFIPIYPRRSRQYRWILWNRDSPMHKTSKWSDRGLKTLSGIFNWTMSYRSDSDIPVPFGRTVALPAPIEVNMDNLEEALAQLVPYWHQKQNRTLAMTLANKCNAAYYTPFTEEMKVDIYWKSCPRDKKTDCVLPEQYLFFIAFEDTSCVQYITETIFHHAYSKGAIPVISGPPVADCERLLPPNSFLHIKYYEDLSQLVKHMQVIAGDYTSLLTFHTWRQHFSVVNEHGVFNTTSYQLCRVCEALNFNDDGTKIYNSDDLNLFYNDKLFCNLSYYKSCESNK